MKKIFSILLALVLMLSFSLVTAVPVAADTINVPGNYETIQAAINAAGPDDTIGVAAGTYVEDLVIPGTKTNLELVGAAGATIKGVQVLEHAYHAPAIGVHASGVKIHGFTIESPDYSGELVNPHSSGIAVGAADVEIYENSFVSTDINNTLYWCTSIETYGIWEEDVSGLNIHDNTFTSTTGTDKGSEGIYINYNPDIPDPVGTVTIANNTFGGQIFRAITTERSKTTISGNTIRSSYAPLVGGSPFSAALRGIDISSTVDNLNLNQDTVVMIGNTINGFYWGFCLGATDNNLTNISLTENTIATNTVGIEVRSSADGVVVNNNNIIGNTGYGVENADTAETTLDATSNWWGAPSGPDDDAGVINGSGDKISTFVNATAWLETAPSSVSMTAEPIILPTVATSPATDVNFTLATLNGDLTDMGTAASVDVWFEWGKTTSYGEITPFETKTAVSSFSATLTGLDSYTVYHFRAVAESDDGISYGGDVSFRTVQVIAPAVTTNDATDVEFYSATLKGNLGGLGSATSVAVSFEWDTDSGAPYAKETTPATTSELGDFSATLTNLTPGQTYYFRAKAVGDSTAYGSELSFTTTAERIGISVSPTSIDFGSILAGQSSGSKKVTVTNEGNIVEKFTASLSGEDPLGFYTANLAIDDGSVSGWSAPSIAVYDNAIPSLVLSIPSGATTGTKTAIITFMAEKQ